MPIEFRCTSCSKLLRTPDESAGKKAKCPQCGTIVDVPTSSDTATAGDALAGTAGGAAPSGQPADLEPPSGDVVRDPFSGAAAAKTPDSVNPYAAPAVSSMAAVTEPGKPGELRHSSIDFDSVLKKTWTFFSENMGPLALFGVVVFAMNAAKGVFDYAGGFAAQATNEELLVALFQFISGVIGFLLQCFIAVGTVTFMTKMARTRQATLNDFFAGARYFLAGMGVNLVLVLIFSVILLLCMAPTLATIPLRETAVTVTAAVIGGLVFMGLAIFIGLRYTLVFFFLVDRQAGVFESLRLSAEYMRGNKGTAFLIFLVVGILGGLFVCVTCAIGQILYIPYWGMLSTVVYMTATGQPWDEPKL